MPLEKFRNVRETVPWPESFAQRMVSTNQCYLPEKRIVNRPLVGRLISVVDVIDIFAVRQTFKCKTDSQTDWTVS